jgi:hypothetical protein
MSDPEGDGVTGKSVDAGEACREEVLRTHRFLERWLAGHPEATDERFRAFEGSLADEFIIIHPAGNRERKATIIEGIRRARGSRGPSFSIEIRAFELRIDAPPCCLVTYEEWHDGPVKSARSSSAWFRRRADGRAMEWVHLHETWLPGRSPA